MAPGWNRPAALAIAMAAAAASAGCDAILGIDEATLDPSLTGAGGQGVSTSVSAGGTGGAGGAAAAGGAGTGGTGGLGGSGGLTDCPSLDGPALVPVEAFGDTYCIDATEVSKSHYKAWLDSGPTTDGQAAKCAWNTSFVPTDPTWPPVPASLNRPVTHVDWCDAFAYCASVGKRLCGRIGGGSNALEDYSDPTMSAWLNACSHEGMNAYPYGGVYNPLLCNGMDYLAGATIDVGSAPGCVGGYRGVHDMSGNVWEWEDSCSADMNETDTCRRRGGSYFGDATDVRCLVGEVELRNAKTSGIGFRCCLD